VTLASLGCSNRRWSGRRAAVKHLKRRRKVIVQVGVEELMVGVGKQPASGRRRWCHTGIDKYPITF
jgi:hypothetical protein